MPFARRAPLFYMAPQAKPLGGPSRVEIDPQSPFAQEIVCAVLFDNPNVAGGTFPQAAPGLLDYARPSHLFTYAGGAMTTTRDKFGFALNTPGTSVTDMVNFTSAPISAEITWTVSANCKFLSGTASSGNVILFGNTATTQFVASNGTDFQFSGTFYTPQVPVPGDNLWHRITVTGTATASTFYIDGISKGTNAFASTPFTINNMVNGWPFPVTDVLIWNRVLSAAQVLAHYLNPSAVFRPRGNFALRTLTPRAAGTPYFPLVQGQQDYLFPRPQVVGY